MRQIDRLQESKTPLFQELNSPNAASGSDSDLLEQFSSLLDKISLQLNRTDGPVQSYEVEQVQAKKPEQATPEKGREPHPQVTGAPERSEQPQQQSDESVELCVKKSPEEREEEDGSEQVVAASENKGSEETPVVSVDNESAQQESQEATEVIAPVVAQQVSKGEIALKEGAVKEIVKEKVTQEEKFAGQQQQPQDNLKPEQQPLTQKEAVPVKEAQQLAPKERQIIEELVKQMEPAKKGVEKSQPEQPILSPAAEQALRAQLGDTFVDKNFAQSRAVTPLAQLVLPIIVRQMAEGFGASQGGVGKLVSALAGQNQQAQPLQLAVASPLNGKGVSSESVKEKATNELNQLRQLRTLEKVEQVLKEAAKAKDGKSISVRLDPPSLGSVKVDVSLRDGALHARLAAESSQVNQLLREKAFDLQRALRAVGLEVDQVTVSVRDEGASQTFDFRQSRNPDSSQQQLREESGFGSEGAVASSGKGSVSGTPQNSVEDHWVA